mgnify:CR=1 FL=1
MESDNNNIVKYYSFIDKDIINILYNMKSVGALDAVIEVR